VVDFDLLKVLTNIVIWAPPVLLAVTLHEVGHGYAAHRLGDSTAAEMGRLTLNPIKHADLMGTVIVPIAMMLLTPFVFGWAKPVPINAARLNNPRRDMIWVAIAGPGANIIMAICWALVFKIASPAFGEPTGAQMVLATMAQVGIMINFLLAAFNILPIPPLDGSRVLMSFLSPELARPYAQLERYGMLIIVGLMMSGLLWKVLNPMLDWLYRMLNLLL
jgi:Zn-dependent protease